MDAKEEEFLKRLESMFKVEAEEHINILSSGLIELEKKPNGKKSVGLIESIFREAHSLKGAARSVGRTDIESICQILESIFAKLKNNEISFTANQFDLIHKAIDTISKMVSGTENINLTEKKELVKQLQTISTISISSNSKEEQIQEQHIESKPQVKAEVSKSNLSAPLNPVEEQTIQLESVRIPISKLDPLFLQAEQMIQAKVTANQRTIELKNIYGLIGPWKRELNRWSSHGSAVNLNQSKEIANWTYEKLDEIEKNLLAIIRETESDQRLLGRMIDEHVESMKKILMLPISTITEGFPKLVRDLARSQGKEVELIIDGKDIEVDKRILEELKDPLVHLIRNCIDHGITNSKEKLKVKKTSKGTITITFKVVDSRILQISISDNGEGINLDKVTSSAVKFGILSPESAKKMGAQESLDLIFKSGITTSPMITDISGRGLGLAIVREKVIKLGGTIAVESNRRVGTSFSIFLPLTLSTSRGVLVNSVNHLFFIPTANVDRVLKINEVEIKTTENKETILLDNEIIGIIKLSDILGLKGSLNKSSSTIKNDEFSPNTIQVVVIIHNNKRIGVVVDEIYDEFQILVKKLGKQLVRLKNISGATVLGTGKVVPVINVSDLMISALTTSTSIESNITDSERTKTYRILVVDDSITSRTLIKNIVESAGYIVETAVDGMDAFTKTLVGKFDLIVSDVDMPRMNGFEYTAKIRKEKKLAEIPVVLVTALESREDREHGIDVGANAYIVKSSFDQSNLLEVIEKLL